MSIRNHRLSYEKRRRWIGLTFLIPWLIGSFTFFVRPAVQTLWYSFCTQENIGEKVKFTLSGLQNYSDVFTLDRYFLPKLTESLTSTLYEVPIILLFSMVIAVLLSKKFHGSAVFQTVFFVPVIVASGVVVSIIRGDGLSGDLMSNGRSGMMFEAVSLNTLMLESGVSENVVNAIMYVVNNIFELSWKSGVQILVFIAGLRTVPDSLYEVARIEGANSWEIFWKITFKMISPMIIINVVYTIVDTFSDYQNPVMVYISSRAQMMQIGYSSAIAWLYFGIIFVVAGLLFVILSRRTFDYSKS